MIADYGVYDWFIAILQLNIAYSGVLVVNVEVPQWDIEQIRAASSDMLSFDSHYEYGVKYSL